MRVLKPAGTFPDLKHLAGRRDTNVALDYHLRRGDVEQAFAAADHVFEHDVQTQQVMHTPLEPFVSVADAARRHADDPHRLAEPVLRAHRDRAPARLAGEPRAGEGAVSSAAASAPSSTSSSRRWWRRWRCSCSGRSRLSLTMEEQFFTITKHATHVPHQERGDEGRPRSSRGAARCTGTAAPMPTSARASRRSPASPRAGPYDIENVAIDSYALYTNRPPAGALRGFGIPQLVWAYESHTDLIARELGIDPVEFRRKNMLRDGRPQATGTIMRDAAHRRGAGADRRSG